ncbi:MAG: hypothetical protein JNL70_09115 [Saprospiraceae bacterium]|nr:hypothetical protein [Saprospiraceae bacterium]
MKIIKKLIVNNLYRKTNRISILNLRQIALFLFFIFFKTVVFAQHINTEPKAYATLDTNMMLIGDKGTLHLSVELNGGERVVQATPDMPLDTAHFEIPNAGKWGNPSRALKWERDIAFVAWDSGLYRIEPVVFTIQMANGETRQAQTPPVLLTVNNPIGIDAMAAPVGIKDIEREELTAEDILPYVLGVVLIGGIAFLAWFFYKKWKNRDLKPVVQTVVQPPHIIAERLLQELKAKQLWQKGNVKEYYSELSHILRGYFEDQFTMPALESTTNELITILEKRDFEEAIITQMRHLLKTADLVKFAKVEPATDVHDGFWHDAAVIVEATKPKPVVEGVDNQNIVKENA